MYNSDPARMTAADLQNPYLDAEALRAVAVARPDLRQAVLQHPNCHGELAQYIYELDSDPEYLRPYPEQSSWQYHQGYQQTDHHQPPFGSSYTPPARPDEERLWGVLMHVAAIFFGFIPPLIVWLIYRDRSQTLDQQGRAALNWHFSYLIYIAASSILAIVLIGAIIAPVVLILDLVFCIIAAVKAGDRQAWKFPLSIPFFRVDIHPSPRYGEYS